MTEGIKLHLGCGSVTPAGWVHMDGSWNALLAKQPFFKILAVFSGLIPKEQARLPWTSGVLVRDVRKPLPFPDRSVRAIYTGHMLDYLYPSEAKQLLKECLRVLRPGGIFRVAVEDMPAVLREYFGERGHLSFSNELADFLPMDRLMMRIQLHPEMVRGNALYELYQRITDFHSRKWAYDEESLMHHLTCAGFSEVARRDFLDSRIEKIGEVEKNPGICVEGIRPE